MSGFDTDRDDLSPYPRRRDGVVHHHYYQYYYCYLFCNLVPYSLSDGTATGCHKERSKDTEDRNAVKYNKEF